MLAQGWVRIAEEGRAVQVPAQVRTSGTGPDLYGRYSAPLHTAEAGGVYAEGGAAYTVNGRVYQKRDSHAGLRAKEWGAGGGWELRGVECDGGAVYAVCWAPGSESILATGSRDGVVRVWDLRAPSAAVHAIKAHEGQVCATPNLRPGTRNPKPVCAWAQHLLYLMMLGSDPFLYASFDLHACTHGWFRIGV